VQIAEEGRVEKNRSREIVDDFRSHLPRYLPSRRNSGDPRRLTTSVGITTRFICRFRFQETWCSLGVTNFSRFAAERQLNVD
jgi:hypothetical protein